MTTGIIFDMDGVLIDSEEFYFKRRMDFFQKIKIAPGSINMEEYVGKTEKGIWETLVPNDQALRSKLYLLYKKYQKDYPINFQQVLRKEAEPLLRELKKERVKIGLASSSPLREIENMLSQCNLEKYFDCVSSGESLRKSKPHPEIYLKQKQALACSYFFAIEDSVVGIKAAKAAEIYTIALKQSFYIDQSEADEQISELNEIPQILRRKTLF